MPCVVAAASASTSPMFASSPGKLSPLFCKPAASPSSPSPSRLLFKNITNQLNGIGGGGGGGEGSRVGVQSMIKRKRPTRIDIPVLGLGLQNLTATVSDLDRSTEVVVEGEGYSLYAKRGKRGKAMEDRYAATVHVPLGGDSKQAFFGVFDGHGGAAAAEFASNNLEKNIRIELSKSEGKKGIQESVKQGYLNTDSEFLNKDIRGGACCVTAFIHQGDLVVSNAGDCRAVMCRGGVAEALTVDHRPSRNDERQRIESLGGYVDCCRGVWRVHGSLAVSRAIGDGHLKKWVCAEPETRVVKMSPDCEFLILASDGVWDYISNQEAVELVRLRLNSDNPNTNTNTNTLSACKKLVDLSITRGSTDDTTVIIIQLTQFLQL